MKRRTAKELTVEEFDEWVAAAGRFEELDALDDIVPE